MMRRGKLIYRSQRHQWAARAMLARQPLVARLTKHQRLAQELGVPAFPTPVAPIPTRTGLLPAQTTSLQEQSFLPEKNIDSQEQSILPSPGLIFLPPLNTHSEDEHPLTTGRGDLHGRPSQPSPPHHQPHTPLSANNTSDEAAPVLVQPPARPDTQTITPVRNQNQEPVNIEIQPEQPVELEAEAEMDIFVAQHDEIPQKALSNIVSDELVSEGMIVPEEEISSVVGNTAPEAQNTEASLEQESALAPEQVQSTFVEAAKPPTEIIKPRRPRRSIEELPTQPGGGSNPSSQPRKEAQSQSRTHEQPQTSASSQNPTTINPDDLFAPSNTDRSPQAWLARLMGKSVPGNVSEGVSEIAEEMALTDRVVNDRVPARGTPTIYDGAALPPHARPEGRAPRIVGVPLAGTLGGGAPLSPTPVPTVQRTPAPVSMRARRFLRPLVGIDPASVRVHRDEMAARLTEAYQADALAVGDDVEIAPGHQDETPETLGLLAHELTHVARQREPNFVPPVLRSAHTTKTVSPATGHPRTFRQQATPASTSVSALPALSATLASKPTPATSALSASSSIAAADEEGLALQVERRVRQVAYHGEAHARSQTWTQQPGALSPIAAEVAASPPARRMAKDPWGGLPAPWEPLPGWLASPPNTTESGMSISSAPIISQPHQPSTMADRNIVGPPLAGGLGSDAGGLGSGSGANVQRAGSERSVGMGMEAAEMSSSAPTGESAALEPDLDELARQVYARLKRRLDVERQRFS